MGGQVDDDIYKIVDEHSVRIGRVSFRFSIFNNNRLTMTPLLTKAMIRQALAHPKDSPAFWAVSVAYAGHTWKRVPCSQCG
jgi:hypothetical protein